MGKEKLIGMAWVAGGVLAGLLAWTMFLKPTAGAFLGTKSAL